MIDPTTASAVVDWAAYRANLAALAAHVAPAEMMAVVKADGYGHGMVAAAAQARAAGVTWLGAAVAGEARALRAAGDTGRLLCWLYGPDEQFDDLVAADVDLSASSLDELSRIVAAATRQGRRARIHLKIDTGLSRNGATEAQWPGLVAAAGEAVGAGSAELVGVWTHLAASETPEHPSVAAQLAAFDAAYEVVTGMTGLHPMRHVANSAAALLLPQAHHELVRVGIAGYGVDPAPGVAERAGVPLRPVMTLRTKLVNVKQIPAGAGVSYGHTWTAPVATTVGLVPLGYADGLPRIAGNRATVRIGGRDVPIVGRICMDQCVVDLGAEAGDRIGDEVIIFGEHGQDANAFAESCDTIGYEIVTRIGSRIARVAR